jgi:hypothetical protein
VLRAVVLTRCSAVHFVCKGSCLQSNDNYKRMILFNSKISPRSVFLQQAEGWGWGQCSPGLSNIMQSGISVTHDSGPHAAVRDGELISSEWGIRVVRCLTDHSEGKAV